MSRLPKRETLLTLLVLFTCCIYLFLQGFKSYITPINVAHLEDHYLNSQYAKPNSYKYYIDDPELYSYAGWRYVLGNDPSVVNFEHQPLAKYLIGLSILTFGNPAVGQLFVATVCIFLTYLVSRKLLPEILACVPSILLTLDPLFKQQSVEAYLDIFQLAFTLLLFIFVLEAKDKSRYVLLSSLALGLVCLSNSVWSGILTGFVVGVFIVWRQKNLIKTYIAALPWGALIYVLGYGVYFHYHRPLDFIRLHIQQIRFYRSYVPDYPKGEIFRIIFTGKWRKWFGDYGFMNATPYTVFWPITLVLMPMNFVGRAVKKIPDPLVLIVVWIVGWLVFISLKIVFPRYLLVIVPMLYILSVNAALSLYNKYHDHRH